MTKEDFYTDAYRAGVAAAEAYNAEPTAEMLVRYPNPYLYWSEDWQLWNLGWNHTVMQTNI